MLDVLVIVCVAMAQCVGPSFSPAAITPKSKQSAAAKKAPKAKPMAKAKKTATTRPAGLPMRLTPRAPVKSVAELAGAIDDVVPIDGRNQPTLTLTNDKGQEVEVKTCREYYDRIAAGYFPATTAEMVRTAIFMEHCDTRCILAGAWRSENSHVRDFKLDVHSARELPMSIVPDDIDPDHAPQKTKGRVCGDAYPNAKYRVISPFRVEIETDSYIVVVEQIACADFNHDGLEDILFFLHIRVSGGTMRWADHYALTRRSVRGPFAEIPLNHVRKVVPS